MRTCKLEIQRATLPYAILLFIIYSEFALRNTTRDSALLCPTGRASSGDGQQFALETSWLACINHFHRFPGMQCGSLGTLARTCSINLATSESRKCLAVKTDRHFLSR
ncbi:hypothetical protein BOTBODRAFT_546327 [Botryobasidium botryosum FD-172 SS1]|uniref:Uncharacterized protein n=1 Tax=Botryobasidium botryosum (strain FD-172 SS1) TaxID=930990 RepID=A0A067N2K7_BOTB1|nr:hypothetical protein BOTBODRAFT_546327 [Botryobasidium botryosum FD-172 SS1]